MAIPVKGRSPKWVMDPGTKYRKKGSPVVWEVVVCAHLIDHRVKMDDPKSYGPYLYVLKDPANFKLVLSFKTLKELFEPV